MILPGSSGAAAALPFSLILTATGAGVAAYAWVDSGDGTTAGLKVQCPSGTPGTYVNATIARIVEIGGGNYEYQLSAGESADPGKVYYYPNVALHDGDALTARWEDIVDVAAAAGDAVVLGSHTRDDLLRLLIALCGGPVLDFTTNTLVFKCPVTNTTRLTGVRDASGRSPPTIGDLT